MEVLLVLGACSLIPQATLVIGGGGALLLLMFLTWPGGRRSAGRRRSWRVVRRSGDRQLYLSAELPLWTENPRDAMLYHVKSAAEAVAILESAVTESRVTVQSINDHSPGVR